VRMKHAPAAVGLAVLHPADALGLGSNQAERAGGRDTNNRGGKRKKVLRGEGEAYDGHGRPRCTTYGGHVGSPRRLGKARGLSGCLHGGGRGEDWG
jgi:hypothetical protein